MVNICRLSSMSRFAMWNITSSSREVWGYMTWLRKKKTNNAIVPWTRIVSRKLPSKASAKDSD